MMKNNLRAIRKARGFKSVEAYASLINKPISTITSHENGSRAISEADVEIYCDFFHVSRKKLLGEDDVDLTPSILKATIKGFCRVQERYTKLNGGIIDDKVIDSVICDLDKIPEITPERLQIVIEHYIVTNS